MIIEWSIQKKRGNHRPVLKYEITLEQFEIDLAMPHVLIENAIARPPAAWRSYCYPGEDERGDGPLDWYPLMTPSHKTPTLSNTLTLAWRKPEHEFEDVKSAFAQLRTDFEATLTNANDSAPVEIVERLELSEDTKKHIAAGIASARFLAVAGF